ncbi:MAG: hypothetical protein Q8R32_02220, partial [bacterium]|nr:hypothetical protein [bacterium]
MIHTPIPGISSSGREEAAKAKENMSVFGRALARVFWRVHRRFAEFVRCRTARILLLCEIAALLIAYAPTAYAPTQDPTAILLALVAVAALLSLISVPLLAALCGLLLLGAGVSASVVTIEVAERLATSAYYVLLIIVARQLLAFWLANTTPGGKTLRLGARVEDIAYENLRDVFVVGIVTGISVIRQLIIVAYTIAQSTFRFVRHATNTLHVRIGSFFFFVRHTAKVSQVKLRVLLYGAMLLCLRSVLSIGDAFQRVRFGPRREDDQVPQSVTLDQTFSRERTTGKIRALRQRRAIRTLTRAFHSAGGWFATARFPLYVATLFAIPFFWFRYGEGDFGGDSSRLYFYDPLSWLRSLGLNEVNVGGY